MNSKKNIIALTGLMGSGKTTIGSKLAEMIGYYFIDSDQEIEDREKCSINEIFSLKGEKYFRQIEKEIIIDIIKRDEKIVLSLGGGSFIDDEIRNELQKKATTIWLDASIDTILMRVSNKQNRPLLNSKNNNQNYIINKRKILEELSIKRNPIYSKADYKIDTTNENHENLINNLIKNLNLSKIC